mmetsp:Transcript_3644/g.4590  ORF Transcript_3644/g.4590 Transcript_3644/m.4590 type:complete len:232 (-) Transcript_3644:222-917(-)|eukprot:CAMPEP_0114359866 /NCGR_PEP_ID=MMETSP0101-20121206/23350_1 /TAXON_ID=38822 ORGANISM="Pteridomonas danica, Strain PT" /NCGR_SAMPLE_ID=MMETSP0101 /ASSEMBLY_ACC=CAM_ASM_000211 /LENGTH=231 /DNA_ID=CAMNT_0001503647 /DNA_START=24 /DNA_END=719 /DNA_ORIENTATION=+
MSDDNSYYKLQNDESIDQVSLRSDQSGNEKFATYVIDTDGADSIKSIDELNRSKRKAACKYHCTNCGMLLFGVLITLASQLIAFKIGLISFPDNGTKLESPECYACVGLAPLDGEYASLIDMKVSGIEFKVKTSQIYHGDSMTVDTVVDVMKDPVGIFTSCTCLGVSFSVSPINCTIYYAYDDCVNNCDAENGIDEERTVYDPKTDQIESQIVVTVLGVPVEQVAVFTPVD